MADSQGAVVFAINGEKHSLSGANWEPGMTLNEYIRRHTPYKGTKLSCGEGGCGACAVTLSRAGADGKEEIVSVNSCLRPLASMHGWAVTTTEGLCRKDGELHPIQQRIADFHGSQCGFCTPGMVMTTYTALRKHPKITKKCMEGQFDGNICRCTGYRPILDAAKSFTVDVDIEEVAGRPCVPKPGVYDATLDPTAPAFLGNHADGEVRFSANGVTWVRPANLAGALSALAGAANGRVVAGNTSVGVYKDQPEATTYVDIHRVAELREIVNKENELQVGATCTLSELADALVKYDDDSAKCAHMKPLLERVVGIANLHVRNAGTIAGNLVMAKTLGFLSDLATSLLGANASVVWCTADGASRTESMERFLASPDINRKEILKCISIPYVEAGGQFGTYKAALRRVNAHAYVNAALYVRLGADKETVEEARFAFGGVMADDVPGSHAVRASGAEQAVVGQKISDDGAFAAALQALQKEVKPCAFKADYRANLVRNFLYRFWLRLRGDKAAAPLRSGAAALDRGLSSGRQKFEYGAQHAPVAKALPKISARAQAAGDAQFTDDIPLKEGSLFGALVLTTVPNGKLVDVDSSAAMALEGVRAVLTAKDIPGDNNISPVPWPMKMLVDDEIGCHGQPLAVVVATSTRIAEKGAKLVKVKYDREGCKPPVLNPQIAVERAEELAVPGAKNTFGDVEKANAALQSAKHTVTGELVIGGQKHFYMEPLVAYAVPEEDGQMVVYVGCMWPDAVHTGVAKVLKAAEHSVKIVMRRCGGGFGGKHSHAVWVAALSAFAARCCRRPVRLTLNRNVDMQLNGGREETISKYSVAYNDEGALTAMRSMSTMLSGWSTDFSFFSNMAFANATLQAYKVPSEGCYVESVLVHSNQPDGTVVRGPGEIGGCYLMETMIAHVAHGLGKPPHVVREMNLYPETPEGEEAPKLPSGKELGYYTLPAMWKQLKEKTQFESRLEAAHTFNKENRWRKRGIAIVPMRYEVAIWPKSATVNIYGDGSVVVHHGCCEVGQGAGIKVAQVTAYELGAVFGEGGAPLDVKLVRTAELDTSFLPNQSFTGGSTGSEGSCAAAQLACKQLVKRLAPVLKSVQAEKQKKDDDNFLSVTWPELCAAAKAQSIDLSAHAHWAGAGDQSLAYQNYGVAVSEVEVDVLTGETEVLHSHIIYDCGKSLNPAIDIGQAEGGFVMGVGHVLREEVLYDDNGKLITDGTWEYKPPSYRCIPQKLEVDFLQDSPFDKGVLSSKASGEPPLVLAVSVAMAVRMAITSARADMGKKDFFNLPLPMPVDVIQKLCNPSDDQLLF